MPSLDSMLALNTDNGRIWLVVHCCYTSVCRETEAVFALWRMNIIVLASINFNDSDNGEYDIVVALNISDCNYQWRTETKFKINMSKSLVHTLKCSTDWTKWICNASHNNCSIWALFAFIVLLCAHEWNKSGHCVTFFKPFHWSCTHL